MEKFTYPNESWRRCQEKNMSMFLPYRKSLGVKWNVGSSKVLFSLIGSTLAGIVRPEQGHTVRL